MRIKIEGHGDMTNGHVEIRRQTEYIPPGLRRMPDGSVWYDEEGHYIVTGPDIVTITGEWHHVALPIGEPLSVTDGKSAFRCVVTDQDGETVRLRGERVSCAPKPLPWIDNHEFSARFQSLTIADVDAWVDEGAGGTATWHVHRGSCCDPTTEYGEAPTFDEALAAAAAAFRKLAREAIAEREREIAELREVVG